MDEGSSVAELLLSSMTTMTPAERKIARAILAGYPTLGLQTVGEVAEHAGVSAPTVVRLIAKLGFDGYADFQRTLRDEIQRRVSSPLTMFPEHTPPPTTNGAEEWIASLTSITKATFGHLPAAEYERALELLTDTRKTVVSVGGRFSQTLAYYLHFHLHTVRPRAVYAGGGPGPRSDDLVDFGRQHVLVAYDFRRYQPDTIAFARSAARVGAAVILITDPWLSPIAEVADCVLPAHVEVASPFDSLGAALALTELMIRDVAYRLADRATERMARLERLRDLSEPKANPHDP